MRNALICRTMSEFMSCQGSAACHSCLNHVVFAAGVIQGAIDYYISAPLQRQKIKAFGKVRVMS